LIEFGWNLIMLDWNWVNLTKVDYVTLNLSEIWLCYIEFEWNLIMLHWIILKFDYVIKSWVKFDYAILSLSEIWLCYIELY
jgi:hypothetical protein